MSIQTEINRIQQSKEDIIAELKTKGVDVPENISIDELAELVAEIQVIDPNFYYNKPEIDSMVSNLSEEIGNQQAQIDNLKNKEVDLTGYATETFVNNEINDLPNNELLVNKVAQKVPYVKVAESPVFVNSIDEMVDTSKSYVLISNFNYYAYTQKEITTEGSKTPNFTNVMDNPNAYVKDGYRWSLSSKAWRTGTTCTIVIPVPKASTWTIRVRGASDDDAYGVQVYYGVTNQSFTTSMGNFSQNTDSNGDVVITCNGTDAGYVQFCVAQGVNVDDLIVTVNEEITYTVVEGGTQVVTEWFNTGISYNQPADYEQRVIDVENGVEELQSKNAELSIRVNDVEANKKQIMYISPNGSDDNDGLTPSTPKKTVKACVNAGATKISAQRGTYDEEINLSNIDELEIFPTDNDYTFNASVKRFPPIVFDTSHTISVDSLSAYNSIKKVAYAETNEALSYVFTNGYYDKVYSTNHGYHAVLWLITDNIKNDIKLKPLSTIAEVEATTNSFTWVANVIYLNADLTNVKEIRVPTSYNNAFTVITANKIKLTDVEFNFAGRYNILIENCPNVEMDNCATKYSSNGSGFDFKNVNGTFRNCYASRVHDGYGIGDYGHTTFIDCVAEYCFDDGMSHHRGCTGTVIGGRYEGNVKAGNCPAHGVNVNIYGGLYKDNGLWGIAYYYENTHNPSTGMVQNAIMVGNPKGLVVDTGCTVTALDCKYVNNTQDKEANGTLIEY